jgi:hypothetical protein
MHRLEEERQHRARVRARYRFSCSRRVKMAKPPSTPPSSDVEGVRQDQVPRTEPATLDEKAQRESDAREDEATGRPPAEKGNRY